MGATLAGGTGTPQAHHPIALEAVLHKHIHPKWDRVKLANVSHSDVQTWVSELARGHSPATVHKIHRALSLVLDMAVKDDRLARNVARGVNLPQVGKHEHRYLTHEQVDDLRATFGRSPALALPRVPIVCMDGDTTDHR